MNYFSTNIKLLRLRRKRTQNDLAVSLNLKRTSVNALENQISQPTVTQLQLFSKFFGIAIDTLINTDLRKLSESQFTDLQNGFDVFIRGSNIRVIATTVNNDNIENIEFVNEKAKAGYANGFADAEYVSSLPAFQLPFLSKEKKYRAFSISGDSMLPIPDGSIIIGEYILDFNDIINGHAYIVVTRDDGVVFKIAENLVSEKRAVKLSSLNLLYKPFEIAVTEIREIWKFVSYINSEMPGPPSEYDILMENVSQLKQSVSELQGFMKK